MDEAMDMRFDMVAQGKALGELLPGYVQTGLRYC